MNIIRVGIENLRLHEAANTIPLMRAEEWQTFLADVCENGVLEPVVLQRGDVILDGRHRWQAAQECGQETIPARVVDLSPTEQVSFIIRAAVMRRHLSDDQRAILAARLREPLSRAAMVERAQKAVAVRDGTILENDVSPKIEDKPRTTHNASATCRKMDGQ